MKAYSLLLALLPLFCFAQPRWTNVDSAFGPLPSSVHVYYTSEAIDTNAFRAYYVIADLKDKQLNFTTDTTLDRRFTPTQFFERNKQPLVVVNGTFFSFETNRNLNVVLKDGKLVSYNVHNVAGRGKDTLTYRHSLSSAIGISKKRTADVAWVYADSTQRTAFASQLPVSPLRDSTEFQDLNAFANQKGASPISLKKWKMQAAIGGGPSLLTNGEVHITNNEEMKFAGKAINDKHPRTAMGYTRDNKLIILMVEGRNPRAGGATLTQEAQLLKDLGCVEALNLDGGGSSCLLVNGKETIKPSDKTGQRLVPAVFLIQQNR